MRRMCNKIVVLNLPLPHFIFLKNICDQNNSSQSSPFSLLPAQQRLTTLVTASTA